MKQIHETFTFKDVQHQIVEFYGVKYEVAVCKYGNKQSEVYMIRQFETRPQIDDGTLWDKMTFTSEMELHQVRAIQFARYVKAKIDKEMLEN